MEIAICSDCGSRNRLSKHASHQPVCGKCGSQLPQAPPKKLGWSFLLTREAILFLAAVALLYAFGLFLAINETAAAPGPPFPLLEVMILLIAVWLGFAIGRAIRVRNNDLQVIFTTWMGDGIEPERQSRKLDLYPILVTLILVVPIAQMMISPFKWVSIVLFWWNVVILTALLLARSIAASRVTSAWDKTLFALSAAWGFLTLFSSFSVLRWSPSSAVLAEHLGRIGAVVDIRRILGALTLTLLTGTAVVRALQHDAPRLPSLPPWSLPPPPQTGFLSAALFPVLKVLSVFLLAAHGIVDLLWKALFLLAVFFGRIGQELASTAWDLLTDKEAWIIAGKFAATIGLFFAALFVTVTATPVISEYVRASGLLTQAMLMIQIVAYVASILISLWLIVALVNSIGSSFSYVVNIASQATIGGLGWILMIAFVAGMLLHLTEWFGRPVTGFGLPGLFSWIILVLIVGGVVYSVTSAKRVVA